jgi:hypothetical protein
MSKEREIPSERQLANILRVVLGPPEDWDEADADFVLEVNGIDPAEAPSRLARLIQREIESRTQTGEEVPVGLRDLHSKLIKKVEVKDGLLLEAKRRIKELFSREKLLDIAPNRVIHVHGRRVKKLTEDDRKILQELADELMNEDKDASDQR